MVQHTKKFHKLKESTRSLARPASQHPFYGWPDSFLNRMEPSQAKQNVSTALLKNEFYKLIQIFFGRFSQTRMSYSELSQPIDLIEILPKNHINPPLKSNSLKI
jgi:hypothetical protein